VASIVAFAFFMETLDGAAIVIVLPHIASAFGVGLAGASLSVTIYMVSLAIFIPMSGWAGDRFGPRNVFCWAIAAFTLASVACGLSPQFWMFIVARTIQGAAAAFMSPVGRVIVLRSAPKHEMVGAFGITIWPGLIAPIVGQPIGGVIATYASWEWIFFMNVPLGIIGIAMMLTFVDNRKEDTTRRLDLVGLALTAASLSALLYGLDRLAHQEPQAWLTAGLIVGGLIVGIGAIRHAHGHPYPLIDTTLARVPNFAATSIWGGTPFRIAMGAAPFLLPLLFQVGFGMTAFDASLMMLAYAGGNLLMKAVTTAMIRRYGFRRIIVVTGLLVILSFLSFALFVPGVPLGLILIGLAFAGVVRSLQFTALNTLAFADIPHTGMSNASALHAMVQQICFAFGIALGAVILSFSATLRGGAGAAIGVADFQIAFLAATVMTIVAMPSLFRLAHDAGDEVSGYGARRARS
jgi:EmrB/QacA subfamily drug resistance transporter